MNRVGASGKTVLIVGAGPAGLAVARQCADAGCRVEVIERRDHLAGNCFDEKDEHGVLVHRYGPHYFRTRSLELMTWLSRFTEWMPGRYYVRAKVDGGLVPLPVSLSTMTALTGRVFSEQDFRDYLSLHREPRASPANAEEQCLSLVGRELYELLFKNYTTKQWGLPPSALDASVTARLPLRFDWDERYVGEPYQAMPKRGYTALYTRMSEHEGIEITQGVDLDGAEILRERGRFDATVHTGPIDRLFGHRHGDLSYRSLSFRYVHHAGASLVQPCVQINYPNDHDYTRSVEYKHVTQQDISGTTVGFEVPQAEGEPFYPLPNAENEARYARYAQMAAEERSKERPLYLVGRLAEYRYLNMDQVLLRATAVATELLQGLGLRQPAARKQRRVRQGLGRGALLGQAACVSGVA